MKKWENPELNKLGIASTEKSANQHNDCDGTTWDGKTTWYAFS